MLALFSKNPFPDHPPRNIRALIYRYRLTDPAIRAATGAYWKRKLLGVYFPAAQLAPEG